MATSNNSFTLNGSSPLGTQTTTPTTSFSTATPTLSASNFTAPTTSTAPKTYSTLSDYYSANGGYNTWDSAQRQADAMKAGITGYTGSADQNAKLLSYLTGSKTTSGLLSPSSTTTSAPTSSGVLSPSYSNFQTPQTQQPTSQPYAQNPQLYGQITTGLANMSKPSDAYVKAQEEANRINQQIEQAKAQMAQQTKDINTSGTWTSRALGEQGQADIANKATLAALGSQYQGATAQIANANTQQQLQQSALQQAGGLAAPITGVQYGTQVYDPVTGTFQSGGSPFTGGQYAGQADLGKQYALNQSAFTQANAVKNQITNFLTTTPINPSSFTDINSIVGLLSGKVSDPRYAQLSAQLTEYLNTLAPILGVGGDTTNFKTQIAQSMLNGKMSPEAINQVLNTIEQTAQAKLQAQAQVGGTGSVPTGASLFSW